MNIFDRKTIIDLINSLNKKFDNLDSGNCGTFSIALQKYLTQDLKMQKLSIAFLTEQGLSKNDIFYGDFDLYHVFLIIDSNFIDSTGFINYNYLIKFSKENYDNDKPSIMKFTQDKINKKLLTCIRSNTCYTIEDSEIYNYILKITGIKRRYI